MSGEEGWRRTSAVAQLQAVPCSRCVAAGAAAARHWVVQCRVQCTLCGCSLHTGPHYRGVPVSIACRRFRIPHRPWPIAHPHGGFVCGVATPPVWASRLPRQLAHSLAQLRRSSGLMSSLTQLLHGIYAPHDGLLHDRLRSLALSERSGPHHAAPSSPPTSGSRPLTPGSQPQRPRTSGSRPLPPPRPPPTSGSRPLTPGHSHSRCGPPGHALGPPCTAHSQTRLTRAVRHAT